MRRDLGFVGPGPRIRGWWGSGRKLLSSLAQTADRLIIIHVVVLVAVVVLLVVGVGWQVRREAERR